MSDFAFMSSFSQMLRVQRVSGKSRGGASVPLCVKLQGAALCGKPQHQNEQYGSTSREDLELSNGEHKQRVLKTETSQCEQPHSKEQSSGGF